MIVSSPPSAPRTWRAAAAGALIFAAGLALVLRLPDDALSAGGPHLSWWVLVLCFGVAEIVAMQIKMRGGARTVSLAEAPLLLGLFFAAPPALVLARVVGPLLVFALLRRQSPVKLAVNSAVLLFEAATAVLVFRQVLGDAAATSPRAWLAGYAAVLLAGILAAALVTVVIALHQSAFHARDLSHAVLTSAMVSVLVGTLALVAVNALQRSTEAGWLLLAAAGVLLLCYRAYAALTGRHAALAKLYAFTDAISATHEPDEVLRQLLLSARDLAAAEYSEIVFAPVLPDGRHTRLTLDERGLLRRIDAGAGAGAGLDPMHAHVLRSGSALLLGHRSAASRRPEWSAYLKRFGRREALAVPLRDAHQHVHSTPDTDLPADESESTRSVTASLLVSGRVGQVRTFDAADLRLVETIANHAGLALRNGWLINGLTHAVRHDALTGLVNRSYLHQQLSDVLAEIRGGRRAGAAVMICDLNGFKDVNDALGHQMGDVLLQEVAMRAAGALAPGDVLARLGGDEFAILLPGALTAEDAAETAERVLAAIAEPVALADLVISVGMSIGVALAPRHGVESSGLLKRADLAMYAAKATNRGLRIWEPGMSQADAQQLTFAGELRRALSATERSAGDIEAYGQPVASLVSGRVVAVDVVARWRHPERGLLLPEEFLPTAASSGLASELSRSLLTSAIRACAQWRVAGHDLSVLVNLPPRVLADTSLPETLAQLLDDYGVDPDRLTLEIAEGGLTQERSRTLPGLGQLSALGVRVGVEGFGAGPSSLSHLRRTPVRQVKIDPGFVRRIDRDSSDEAIVRSIVELGARLGLDVVAAGVDDPIVWEQLRRMGCDLAQGALLCRPVPLDELADWLAEHAQTVEERVPLSGVRRRSPVHRVSPNRDVSLDRHLTLDRTVDLRADANQTFRGEAS